MKKRLPKGWNKFTNEEQREWISDELQLVIRYEKQLKVISRKLATGVKFELKEIDRPDLENLKNP
jgi:hypothetical protein